MPGDSEKLLFVRSRPVPKLELPGMPVTADPTEVVVGDLATRKVVRVLIPSSRSSWRNLIVSPDGKRLALVSTRGHEDKHPRLWRVFVLDLQGGEPKALTPPAKQVSPVSWTPDSKALVYARSQDPLPPDCWEGDGPLYTAATLDLYQWDLTASQETRLSRGGGFLSPSVTEDGSLFYVTGSPIQLRRMSLADARAFAAKEPALPQRDVDAWTSLIDQVMKEHNVPANADGTILTPPLLAKLVDTFNRVYSDRFRTEPAVTLNGLRRLRRELQSLSFPAAVQEQLTLLVGALEGEYLVRHCGARWHLTKGSLVKPATTKTPSEAESPFGYVVNPFDTFQREAPESVLLKTEGRPLVLANNLAAARDAVVALSDPELSRATELLKQNRADDAENTLLKMMEQGRHKNNRRLGLVVGQVLYEHNRKSALQRLMEDQGKLWPHDARQYNLLGLALLETKPREAIEAFKNALRCDLNFGAAYLNLAQAYERVNDQDSKRLCLHQYLKLRPDGVYADDARQRLAMKEEQNAGLEE
jgi:tetratricopeptide (TPR) repeat protein